jgi:hypothetical protein
MHAMFAHQRIRYDEDHHVEPLAQDQMARFIQLGPKRKDKNSR